MIPIKLKVAKKTHVVNAKRMLYVDEYFQYTPAVLRHTSSQAPIGPLTTDLKS